VTANRYKSMTFWTAWSDGWRYMEAHPFAGRGTLDKAFSRRKPIQQSKRTRASQ